MIKKILIILVILAILATMGLGVFLAPDNLAGCRIDEGPGGSGCEKADAIVVVSGGDTAARTSEAVRLYKAGWAKVLIMSGAAADKTGPSNAAVMRDQAEHEGVPRSHILLDIKSNNTEENAHEVAQIIKAHKFSSIIAVTSGYHQRRVGWSLVVLWQALFSFATTQWRKISSGMGCGGLLQVVGNWQLQNWWELLSFIQEVNRCV